MTDRWPMPAGVPEILTAKEAAAYLRVSTRSLRRISPLALPRIRYGHRTVRYERAALDAYLAKCREDGLAA